MRFGLIALLGLAAAGPAAAQYRAAASPPDAEYLARLNLKSEWSAFVPLQSGRDAVAIVQVVDRDQVFAQTASNLLVALDAVTGATQWTYRFPATHVAAYPVGYNAEFVFAVNVSRVICFARRTGVVEFDFEMPGAATAGPVADDELFYVTVNGTRLLAYTFPPALAPSPRDVPGERNPRPNPADQIARRFGGPATTKDLRDEEFSRLNYPTAAQRDIAGSIGQVSPSIAALPSVTPPYSLAARGLYVVPSISVLQTLRQPYHFKPDYLQYNQRTPSIQVLPPAIARAAELANFRPRGIEPTLYWTHVSGRRFVGQPVLTDTEAVSKKHDAPVLTRLWVATDTDTLEAIDKRTHRPQVTAELQDEIASPMSGPARSADGRLVGFVGLRDGSVSALSLLEGGPLGPRFVWRAGVGGYMNHKPVAAGDAVFASGERSGTAKIDLTTGEVVWRSPKLADQFLAANDEFVYLLDHAGALGIYDRKRASDTATRQSLPLATLPLPGFGVPVTNPETDRLYLASEGGLVVCLRDASAKYVRPVPLAPPPPKDAPPKNPVLAPPPPNDAPPKGTPPKDPVKDAAPPKDAPPKDPVKDAAPPAK
jgi:hypothetical protein